MGEVEILIREKENAISVAYATFVLTVDKYGDNVFCYFIEGNDAPYYVTRIKSRIGGAAFELVPIKCKGKKNVLKIHSLLSVKPAYNKYKKGFFVDCDYDDNSSISSTVYVTPCYSIENFYIPTDVISEILKCELDILPTDENYTKILDLYNRELERFHAAILEFNAWYACLKQLSSETKVSLGDTMPDGFIRLEIGRGTVKQYSLAEIESKFDEAAAKVSPEEIDIKAEELRQDSHALLRGKYQLQFLEKFLRFLIEDANHKNRRQYIHKNTTFNVTKPLIISQFSQYAVTPPCLIEYIDSRLVS